MLQFYDNSSCLARTAAELSPVVTKETFTDSSDSDNIDCDKTPNNPLCKTGEAVGDFLGIIGILIVFYILFLIISIVAILKTKSDALKIFIILGLFLPFLSPITFIVSLLIIFGVM